MRDLLEGLFAVVLVGLIWIGFMALTVIPWALGMAYVAGFL